MSTFYTLVTGGTEKSLQDWGVCLDFSVSWQSKGKGTATLRTVENFDPVATQWLFKQHAVIYRDRTGPAGGPYGGGQILFQGYFDDPQMDARGDSQNVTYRLHSVWWLFERNMFKQYRMQFLRFSKTLNRVIAATILAGGNNYKVGDTFQSSLNGGAGTAATFNVLSVGAGGTCVLVSTNNGGGSYTVLPSPASGVPTTALTGNGGGCTLNLTFAPAPVLTPVVSSEVWLGEDLHQAGGYTGLWPNGNGDQIGEVIDWMNTTYNPTRHPGAGPVDPTLDVVQKGTLDPHTLMPVTRVNTIFCAEAINSCLRWDPDAVISENPLTNPPTLNFPKLGKWDRTTNPPTFLNYTNLPEIPLVITAQQEKEIVLQAQQSRQVPGVIIYYKANSSVDSVQVEQILIDKFPAGIDDYTPEVNSQTVVLQGSSLTHAQAFVNVNQAYPLGLLTSGIPASQATWWTGHDATLRDPLVTMVGVDGTYTAVDMNGNPVNLANYTAELLDNTLPTWAPVARLKVKVSQQVAILKYHDATKQVLDTSRTTLHSKTILVTNATQQLYTAVGSFATGEAAPVGVSESVYRSLANADSSNHPVPLFSGRITFLSQPLLVPTDAIGNTYPNWIGTRLKLTGPHNVFQNLMVQAVEMIPARGQLTLTFGPGPAVDIDLWIELARATRTRMTWGVLPSNRGDGGSSGGSSAIDTGAAAPADDTTHGAGGQNYHSVIAPA